MKINFIFYLLIATVLFSCSKDEDNSTNDPTPSQTIRFNPSKAEWFQREAPDSFVVNVSGGVPPYFISKRPEYINAQISNNEIILFPQSYSEPFVMQKETDFLDISDNAGNVNSLNIDMNVKFYLYQSVSNANIDLTGDANLNISQLINGYTFWDEFEKTLYVSVQNNDDSISLTMIAEAKIGASPIIGTSSSEFRFITSSATYILTGMDSINITNLSENEIKLDFDLDVTTQFSGGNYKLKGELNLVK